MFEFRMSLLHTVRDALPQKDTAPLAHATTSCSQDGVAVRLRYCGHRTDGDAVLSLQGLPAILVRCRIKLHSFDKQVVFSIRNEKFMLNSEEEVKLMETCSVSCNKCFKSNVREEYNSFRTGALCADICQLSLTI
jgi:hypothetical protein